MDAVQMLNGASALAAAVAVQLAYAVSASKVGRISHSALVAVLMWYAVINLGLGFGLLGIADATPYFRWAFTPMMGLYAFRHFMYVRKGYHRV